MLEHEKIGSMRQAAHPNGTPRYYSDPNQEDIIGVAGEIAFGKRYGLKIDDSIRPEGDGHIDFKCEDGNGKIITFDVKAAKKAFNLLVKEWEIDSAATILVLGQYKEDGSVEFLGWQTKGYMRSCPKKVFSSLGIMNYYCPAAKLRKMEELDDIFKRYSIKQIA